MIESIISYALLLFMIGSGLALAKAEICSWRSEIKQQKLVRRVMGG